VGAEATVFLICWAYLWIMQKVEEDK